ncbi:hypothetical protein [sulfur-oxidizing endosymbiont of Gigantopelta aegis]|uniref:hypothetical protein n=1 Tax=sulfur-oxidizing endosymbiont of Gigantopelta aegis TaxID=2794934 RepID=UPI0018DE463A|nr:hypothetical protein [sulfur-oxidizing endosymbiont of Gigantopelta aegis]
MNDIRSSADQALNQMVSAATGFVSSLPALIIQRSNPGLYDLFQNGLLRAEEQFNMSIKSCEEMEADFVAGGNPFDKFVTMSKKNSWQAQKKKVVMRLLPRNQWSQTEEIKASPELEASSMREKANPTECYGTNCSGRL